jgi:hypothetical protein
MIAKGLLPRLHKRDFPFGSNATAQTDLCGFCGILGNDAFHIICIHIQERSRHANVTKVIFDGLTTPPLNFEHEWGVASHLCYIQKSITLEFSKNTNTDEAHNFVFDHDGRRNLVKNKNVMTHKGSRRDKATNHVCFCLGGSVKGLLE